MVFRSCVNMVQIPESKVVLAPELMGMKNSDIDGLVSKAKAAKLASRSLGKSDSKLKNDSLLKIAYELIDRCA